MTVVPYQSNENSAQTASNTAAIAANTSEIATNAAGILSIGNTLGTFIADTTTSLATKAALDGSATQFFQTDNLEVHGHINLSNEAKITLLDSQYNSLVFGRTVRR